MVNLFVNAGIIAISAFISPYEKDREAVKMIIGKENFVEIFVDCPIEECINRDPKGVYKKAIDGVIKNYTGISAPYEKPLSPDLIIESHVENNLFSVQRVIDLLMQKKHYKNKGMLNEVKSWLRLSSSRWVGQC